MDSLTVALRVEGTENELDPAFGLLELDKARIGLLLGYMDQVRQQQADDPGVRGQDRDDNLLTWITDLEVEPRLDEEELLDDDWMTLEGQRLADVEAAIASDPEAEARVEGHTLVCRSDSVSWRSYPKHGDLTFVTPSISRADLEKLAARLG